MGQKYNRFLVLNDIADMKQILENIGYNLVDCGNHWRTRAVYRDGDNPTALQIYKNTGVWIDFIQGNKSKPFEALIQLTLKDDKDKLKTILKSIDSNSEDFTEYKQKALIQMEKTYDNSVLDKLFPNYNFYKCKKISESTQSAFKVGLAGSGQMYRRMVFPVYNEHSQIIGFSGRRVDDNDFAKWKHLGKKNNWIYPAYIPNEESVDSIITKSKEVYLVESIGDAMSLYEEGIKNVLVIFGLSVSASIITYLSSKSLERIIIAGNNDFNSKENRGLMASIKNFLKLSAYFDLDSIQIKNPPKGFNDLGEAHESGKSLKDWSNDKVDIKKQRSFISSFVSENYQKFSKSHIKKAKKINE
jgi:hypothetical protein